MVSGYCWGQGEGSVPDSASLSLVARAGFPFEGVRTTAGRDCFLGGYVSGGDVVWFDGVVEEGRRHAHRGREASVARDVRILIMDETTPLLALPGIVATAETLVDVPKVSSDRAVQTQFSLLVLLYARKNGRESVTGTPWEVMQQKKERLKMAERTEAECMAVWSEFCEEEEDVESVLFGEMDGMRVVDLLDAAPDALLDDELLYATMASVWTKHARALYMLDFAARLATYGLLLSYVMHPPDRPTIYATSGEYMGAREWALLVLSLSDGVGACFCWRSYWRRRRFLKTRRFGLLLVAVFVYTFQLQPVPAYPLFVGLRKRVAETVFPIVAMFLPALLLTCFLLSASLNDVFLTAAVPDGDALLTPLTPFCYYPRRLFLHYPCSKPRPFWQRQMETIRPGRLSRSQTDLLSNCRHLLESVLLSSPVQSTRPPSLSFLVDSQHPHSPRPNPVLAPHRRRNCVHHQPSHHGDQPHNPVSCVDIYHFDDLRVLFSY